MSLLSVQFAIFLLITAVAYFVIPMKYRWVILLIASYTFYAIVDFSLIIFVVITTVSVFAAASGMNHINLLLKKTLEERDEDWLAKNKAELQRKTKLQKKAIFISVLVLNFSILGVFKYLGWLTSVFNFDMSWTILMPLGISYYTFQSLGYLIDVYLGKVTAEKNIFKFALFVSFFPQLIQGPISRFSQLHNQLIEGHRFDFKRVRSGIMLIAWGAFKMLCISVPAHMLFATITNPDTISSFAGWNIILAVIMYSVHIYASFAGGIDIARGVGEIFGIDMAENFKQPYFATGVGDFWRRWHITLGAWMKDYVFYPISLSKPYGKFGKKVRNKFPNFFGKVLPSCLVTFFVFCLVGIWHGAEIKYVVYGVYMGFFVSFGVLMQEPCRRWSKRFPKATQKNIFIRILAILATIVIIFMGRMLIAAPDLATSWNWFSRIFMNTPNHLLKKVGISIYTIITLSASCALLFSVSLFNEFGIKIREFISKRNIVIRFCVYFLFATALLLFAPWEGQEVIFHYGQF